MIIKVVTDGMGGDLTHVYVDGEDWTARYPITDIEWSIGSGRSHKVTLQFHAQVEVMDVSSLVTSEA